MLEVVKKGNKEYATDIPHSTSERRIGTWIDGKPLYRKVIQTTTPTVTTNGTEVWGQEDVAENVSVIKVSECYLISGNAMLPIYYSVFNGYSIRCRTSISSSNNKGILAIISANKSLNNSNVIAIVEYTKTTD